jgi:hypothetical protein
MHEVGDAWDRLRGNVEAVDQARLAAGRGRDRDGLLVIDVEREPDRDPSPRRIRERACHQARGRLLEIKVVQREVEGLTSFRDELADELGDLEGALTPVRQRPDLDRQA